MIRYKRPIEGLISYTFYLGVFASDKSGSLSGIYTIQRKVATLYVVENFAMLKKKFLFKKEKQKGLSAVPFSCVPVSGKHAKTAEQKFGCLVFSLINFRIDDRIRYS